MTNKERIYLDYNATAPIKPQVIEAVAEAMAHVGNASSIHSFGREARALVEKAREQVAALTNARARDIVFTSGATESNNAVLKGFPDRTLLIGATEHSSIKWAVPEGQRLPVHKNGLMDMEALEARLKETPNALVSIHLVNSETGVIQPIKEITTLAHKYDALMHTDAVQAAGRIPIDVKDLDADFLSLSAHKMAGPQGVGALIKRPGLEHPKFLLGGGQEMGGRAGTENVAGIAGFGVAAEIAAEDMQSYQRLAAWRDAFEAAISEKHPGTIIFGGEAPRVANTSCLAIPGKAAETTLIALDLKGIAISSGSACSSGTITASHVLAAMGYDEDTAKGAQRISSGWDTTEEEYKALVDALSAK